jgi:LPXTG-site transpeptidase (sortase) family protein
VTSTVVEREREREMRAPRGAHRVDADGSPEGAQPRSKITRADVLAVAGRGLTALALLVLGLVVHLAVVTRLEQGRDQRDLFRAFRTPLGYGEAPIGGAIPVGTEVAVLEIPRLDLRQVVVEGTTSGQLRKGPGHLRNSPLPGQAGNVVIAGRRLAYGGPFLHLDRLRRGDVIRATTGQGRASYEVTGTRLVKPDQTDVVGLTGDNRLTLVTSDPVLFAARRLVATAALRTAPKPAPRGRVGAVTPTELGMQGEPGAVTPFLIWSELLLVTAVVTAWLYRRWSRWTTWLVTTPVLLLLLLLVYDSFVPLLPATL